MGLSTGELSLLEDIAPTFGVRAQSVLRCLRKLEGVPEGEPADARALDAMVARLEAALEATGTWWRREEPAWIGRNGFRPYGDLIVWVQHLRMEVGESLEVFAPTPRDPGDPLWVKTSRWLAICLDELLYDEGIPTACHKLIKARARQRVCDRYGVPSMRHLPGTICQREAISLILRCDLEGAHEVLELADVKAQLQSAL